MSVLELFCAVDDFCRAFEPVWQREQLSSGAVRRRRARRLSTSEVMTIVILFHQAGYRNFKTFYLGYAHHQSFHESCGRASIPRRVTTI